MRECEAPDERSRALEEIEAVEPACPNRHDHLERGGDGIGEVLDGHHLVAAEASLHLCAHAAVAAAVRLISRAR